MSTPLERHLAKVPRTEFTVPVKLFPEEDVPVTYRIDCGTQNEVKARSDDFNESQFLALIVVKIEGIEELLTEEFFAKLSIRTRNHLLAGLEKIPYFQARKN